MKPLERTDSSDCFSNVHLGGLLGSQSEGGSKTHTTEIWNMSLCVGLCGTLIVPGVPFLLASKRFFQHFSPQKQSNVCHFQLISLSLVLNVYTGTPWWILQVVEMVLIQIWCEWFVQSLSFCSCLIKLCCPVSTITIELLFLHSNRLFGCVLLVTVNWRKRSRSSDTPLQC